MTDQVNHTFIGTLTDHKTHANNTLEATFRVPRGGLVWEVNEDGSLGPRRKQQAGPIDWGALGLEVGPLNPKTPSLTLAHTVGNGEMAGYYLKSMGKTGPNLVTMHLHPLRSDDPVCIGLVKGRRYVCCLDATPAPPTTCNEQIAAGGVACKSVVGEGTVCTVPDVLVVGIDPPYPMKTLPNSIKIWLMGTDAMEQPGSQVTLWRNGGEPQYQTHGEGTIIANAVITFNSDPVLGYVPSGSFLATAKPHGSTDFKFQSTFQCDSFVGLKFQKSV